MAFFDKKDIPDLYTQSKDEGLIWREDYHEFERLADNDLLPDLDQNLPEVNDGSLAASLFKLPKRIVSSKLTGRVKALDADEAWITELANMQWENEIIPNANSQAPYHRKWKDAVRKAAIYGGQPIITLFVENGNYTGSDIIIPQAQDVTLEAGKVSDYDSQIIFWDVYYSKQQLETIIEQAKKEGEQGDGYNKWNIPLLEEILNSKQEEDRPSNEDNNKKLDKGVKKNGYHFYIAFQRGVEAPFYMFSTSKKKCVREWSNPDPTGDVPVHYLYCYQDFVNPYGIGIVKLAGGTQNVLDYMRQSDVLATGLGLRPPKQIKGNADDVDLDSLVYAEDADWFVGNAEVERMELANGIYQELPNRISMYKTSLNQLIPTGDTSISASAGDPNYSKTPQGVKFQESNLSIDDEDFKDNLYMTYAAVAKSMINTHFANMQGKDIMKLSDEERDILAKAGIDFPVDSEGNPTNELEVIWDQARATFDFEVDPEQDKAQDDEKRLEGLIRVAEMVQQNANIPAYIEQSGKRLNVGELFSEIVSLTTDNKKIIEDIDPEDLAEQQAMQTDQMAMQSQQVDEQPLAEESPMPMEPQEDAAPTGDITPEEAAANVQGVMQKYGVDQETAAMMLEADRQGFEPDEILAALQRRQEVMNV